MGVIVMASAIFPTYALARMLVRPWPALVAATLTVVAPALSYSAFLITRAAGLPLGGALLLAHRPRAGDAKASVDRGGRRGSPWSRAGCGTSCRSCWPSPRGRPRGSCGRATPPSVAAGAGPLVHWSAFALGLTAVTYAVYRVGTRVSSGWHVALVELPQRTVRYGVWAGGALTIGLAVLPVVAGLTTLARPRDEARTPAQRAFVGVFGSALVAFCFYTAAKAAYLSTVFAVLVEERNLIYLTPVLAVAFAVWLDRPRVNLVVLGLSGAAVGYLISATPYQLSLHPYAEAPGLAVLRVGEPALPLGRRHGAVDPVRSARILARARRSRLVPRALVASCTAGARAVHAGPAGLDADRGDLGRERLELAGEPLLPRPPAPARLDRPRQRRRAHGLPRQRDPGRERRLVVRVLEPLAPAGRQPGRHRARAGRDVQACGVPGDGAVINDPGVAVRRSSATASTCWARRCCTRASSNCSAYDGPLRLRSSVTGVSSDGWAGAARVLLALRRTDVPAWAPHRPALAGRTGTARNVPGHAVVRIGTLVTPTKATLANPC